MTTVLTTDALYSKSSKIIFFLRMNQNLSRYSPNNIH